MQYKHLGIFAALFFTISWVACRPNNAPKIIAIDAHGGEKFETFYDKFLSDSLFQVSRIEFPLQGRPKMVDSTNYKDEFYFSPELWVMHKKIDFTEHPEFLRTFEDFGIMVREIIEVPKDLFIERRYRQIDGNWFLVFYGDLNMRNKTEVVKPK